MTCPPAGTDWLHEIKYDGYRMHVRIDDNKIQLLTRTGLDWSHRYKCTIEAPRFTDGASLLGSLATAVDADLAVLDWDLANVRGTKLLAELRPARRQPARRS